MTPRILVVEDDPSILELITVPPGARRDAGVAAPDGRRALELFNAHRPDLLLLDLMLPVLDGFEVCRAGASSLRTCLSSC